MAKDSKISWTDATMNPWIGCSKVSQGCAHCYAETLMTRKERWKNTWGPNGIRVRTSEAYWKKPLAWNREAEKLGLRYKVFCGSLCDVFEYNEQNEQSEGDLDQWRGKLWALIMNTPHLDWQLLTKRPENILDMVPPVWLKTVWPFNVWVGTSVEDEETAAYRVPSLLTVPAPVRFLSCEPLLGPINLDRYSVPSLIDWVIVGGESGPGHRTMDPGWVEKIFDYCMDGDVPFFFKQWGGPRPNSYGSEFLGKEWKEFPKGAVL